MNKTRIITLILAVVLTVSGAAYAMQKDGYKHYGDEQKRDVFKALNLTQEQQKNLEENRNAQREEMKKLRAAMKEKQTQLQQALKDPSTDRVSVEPIVNEIKSLQAQSIELRVNGILAVKNILTPQQYAEFQQIMDKRKEGRKGRFSEQRKN